MIQKVASLVGQTICPECYYEIQWDSPNDIEYITGNKTIKCPQCGYRIILLNDIDYLVENKQNDNPDVYKGTAIYYVDGPNSLVQIKSTDVIEGNITIFCLPYPAPSLDNLSPDDVVPIVKAESSDTNIVTVHIISTGQEGVTAVVLNAEPTSKTGDTAKITLEYENGGIFTFTYERVIYN